MGVVGEALTGWPPQTSRRPEPVLIVIDISMPE